MNSSLHNRRGFLGRMGAASLLPAAAREPLWAGLTKGFEDVATRRFRKHIGVARETILAELQPTASQLEHGLTLHRESIVCDLYGGSNPVHLWGFYSQNMKEWILQKLSQEEDRAKKRELLRTLRYQIQKWRALESVHDPGFQANHRLAWDTAQIDLGLADVGYTSEGGSDRGSIEYLASATYSFDNLEYLEKFRRCEDLPRLKKEGKHAVIWHIGRPDSCFAGPHIEDPIRSLDLFYAFGVRHCQLTNSRKNQIGCSHYQEVDTGITETGRAVIQRMNQLGMMIDLSHSGYKTTLEAIKASEEPVLISHTACRSLAEGGKSQYRNATDEAIRAVADKSGMIGIVTVANLLGDYGVNTFLRHLDYAVKLVGVDHVGIASDQGPMGRSVEPPRIRDIGRPSRFSATGLKGTETYWKWETEPRALNLTTAPYITVGLVVRGYSDDDIRKLIGGNFIRVASTIMAKSPRGRLI